MPVSESFQQPSNALVKALREFLDAPTKKQASAILEQNKALLVTDMAAELLHDFHGEQMLAGESMYEPSYITYHYIVLATSILYGIPKGWEEAEKMLVELEEKIGRHTTREELNIDPLSKYS